jgi:N-acetylglucosamine-6-sulfatase
VRGRLVVLVWLCALLGVGEAFAQTGETRPNVVVIMTDDQTVKSLRVMPKVERLLADKGATFANSFVGLSLCCPSRATFLTGQYAHNHHVFTNNHYGKLDETSTLPVWLQNAGYRTIHVGKYLNGYGEPDPTEIPPGWTQWHALLGFATYRYYDYTLNENGRLVTYERAYQTDLLTRKAVSMVERNASRAAPFFLWAAFVAPHRGTPFESDDPSGFGIGTPVPAPRHRNDFASKRLPMPSSFNERNVADKPIGIRKRPRLTSGHIGAIRENYQQRLESLLAVDEGVAAIVSALRASGELKNTLIVFTSDNGFFHGEHRIPFGKILPYEPSIRVPLIMRGPGIPAGLRLGQHVSNIDVAPTIVEAAGATPGRVMDGLSLLPLLQDPTMRLGRDLLVERKPGTGDFSAIRTARYMYAEYWNGERELYDLAKDPYELRSRDTDPAYDLVEQDLAARLAWLRTCAGETCRTRP